MNAHDIVFTAITESAAQTTNLRKVEVLKTAGRKGKLGVDELKAFLHAVLDPRWNYYVTLKNLPEPRTLHMMTEHSADFNGMMRVLRDLHERCYTGHDAEELIAGFLYWAPPVLRALFKMAIDRKLPEKIGRTLVNKAFPDLIYKQPYNGVQPFDADKVADMKWGQGVMVQRKEDGMALLIDIQKREVRTRAGQDVGLQLLPYFTTLYAIFPDQKVLFVEARMWNEKYTKLLPRPESNGIFNAIFSSGREIKPGRIVLSVLDMVDSYEFYGFQAPKVPAYTRYNHMLDMVADYNTADVNGRHPEVLAVPTWMAYSPSEARAICQREIKSGGEGVVLKEQSQLFKNGKTGFKMKNEFECTLECIGFKPHKRHKSWVGSLLLQSRDTLLQTYAGSGLNEIDGDPLDRTKGPMYFVGKLFEVRAENISKHDALNLPRLVEPRLDKAEADTIDEVRAAYHDSVNC